MLSIYIDSLILISWGIGAFKTFISNLSEVLCFETITGIVERIQNFKI